MAGILITVHCTGAEVEEERAHSRTRHTAQRSVLVSVLYCARLSTLRIDKAPVQFAPTTHNAPHHSRHTIRVLTQRMLYDELSQ